MNSDALEDFCAAESMSGQLQQALADCDESLRLNHNQEGAFQSRGYTNLKLGQLDEAISDFGAALKLNQKDASSLYGRGVAERKKGDAAASNADIAAAKAIRADIGDWYVSHGFN